MHIRIDEAGDFHYGEPDRLRISVIAGLAIPDRSWETVEDFVRQHVPSGEKELKAAGMELEAFTDTARFIVDTGLSVAAVACDSHIFTAESQQRWREGQLANLNAAADASWRVKSDPTLAARVERARRRMKSNRAVKQPNFLQYSILMPWLVSRLLSAALITNRALVPPDESWMFDVAIDPRQGADPGRPGKLMRDSLQPIYASADSTELIVPGEWPPTHPFYVQNNDPEAGRVSPRQLLARGINTPDSHSDAGIQLADLWPMSSSRSSGTMIRRPKTHGRSYVQLSSRMMTAVASASGGGPTDLQQRS